MMSLNLRRSALSPLLDCLSTLWQGWQERRAVLAEVDGLSPEDRGRVLHDLGVDRAALPETLDDTGLSPILLPTMMGRFGVARDAVESCHPAVMRDLQRVCAGCRSKAHCTKVLARGGRPDTCRTFCPNAHTLDALAQAGDPPPRAAA